MLGLVCLGEGRSEIRAIRGVRFQAVYVLPGNGLRARRSLFAAARTLRRAHVRQAAFLTDPLPRAFLEAHGVCGVSTAALHRAAAAQLVLRCFEQRGMEPRRASVTLAAETVTPELWRAAGELMRTVRYISLCVPDGEELARFLRRAQGAAVRLVTPGEAAAADLTVCFDPCFETRGNMLALGDPALSVMYDDDLPAQVLAALYEAGALDVLQLRVRAVMHPAIQS